MEEVEILTQVKKEESSLKSFVSGGIGGVCVVLVGHPLDLIKVRIQTGGDGGAGTLGLLRGTIAREGILGLYRGVSAPLLAITPIFAVCFWGYDAGKRCVRYAEAKRRGLADYEAANINLSIPQLALAGSLSAIPATALVAPSERIKCLLQVQANEIEKGGKGKYTGMRDCALQVFREGGMRSVFKGTGLTFLRDIPGNAAYFGVYEVVKMELGKANGVESGELSPAVVVTAGGCAGMANWIVSISADVLKSRFQTAPPAKYSGLRDVYREVIREEGYSGLFRGLRPALIRAFPANGACFFGMEFSRSLLSFMD